VFFRYEDPAEARVELRSSVRLLGMPPGILQTITLIVSMGQAELVCMRDSDRGSYRVEHEGEVYYFDYSSRTGRLEPWNQGK
jgi:hypothetical protein